ncbi:GMC family oxidoreductase [Actinoplanes sp. NPDC049596]|uniref:GMC family oxidoreductase n=1 Tax=unclassified Actinoplanes TaxID=2626549 RepID=UPI00344181E8
MEHVHAVVVGSGFGGSVTAYRLAQAGRSVVLLERGKAHPPGSFARSPAELGRNFWDPSAGLHGLFDVWSFRGLDGVVSSGLGGGSLIYANVLLRKDERWFVHDSALPGGGYENWPISRADLDPHYDEVERMLGATVYPYADTRKTVALQESAQRLGLSWDKPPLAVAFAGGPGAAVPTPYYGNLHGRPRRACRLCGECDIGCNDGAKNSLDHTYLSAAQYHGADLRTRSEVRTFRPLAGGGYEVTYVHHDPAAEGHRTATRRLPPRKITCDRLILAAGTFGTSFLLLRNRAAFPGISTALGTRFSGNGDLLAFLMGARDPKARDGHRRIEGSRGPVITSAIRVPDEHDGDGATGRGFYIEDAGYPVFAEWLVEAARMPGLIGRAVRFALARLRGQANVSALVSALIGPGSLGDGSLPLLGMGRDVPDGVMRLRRGQLDVDWSIATSADYLDGLRSAMRSIADDLGGRYVDPLRRAKKIVTVHPLGGAPMGRHPGEGVCDTYGEVFGYPGLHVLDGSVLPGPVGANPSLTIAAVADRACDHMLTSEVAHRRPVPEPPASSLSFTEEMKGFVARGTADPEAGAADGRKLNQRLSFRLTITADDVEKFVADPDHEARAEGHVDCDLLGGRLEVERGWFNLFVPTDDPDGRRMLYRLHLAGGLTLTGHKEVHDDPGVDLWRDTSTLYVRVLAGHVPPGEDDSAETVAAGVITIHVPDFLRQLTTFKVTGPRPAQTMAEFGRLFVGELWDVYHPAAG